METGYYGDKNSEIKDAVLDEINGIIDGEQKKINEALFQIGVLYANTHKEDYEPEFAELFNTVNSSEAAINEQHEKRREHLGLMICHECGEETPVGNKFCVACGTQLIEDEPKLSINDAEINAIVCTACGAETSDTFNFCHYCGKPMTEIKSELEAAKAAEQKTAKKFCVNCGVELSDGMHFCVNCGASVSKNDNNPHSRICPSCGAEKKEASVCFCTECGSKFDYKINS